LNHAQGSTISALLAIQTFLDAHPEFASLKDSTARNNLDVARTHLESFGTDQSGGAQAAKLETSNQRSLRLALRKFHMEGIAHAAKQTLAGSPDLSELSMPKGRPSVPQLLKAAAGMSQAARRHEASLLAGGMTPGFIEELAAATAALQASLNDRTTLTIQRAGATAGLKNAEKQARSAIKVMNVLVLKPIPPNESGLGRAWVVAKRIAAKAGLPRGASAAAAAADSAGVAPPSSTAA